MIMSKERTDPIDVSDRGSSPYFHGIENEFNDFNAVLNASFEEKKHKFYHTRLPWFWQNGFTS